MADTAGSAGEVRVRLALDASDLKSQISAAEKEIGGGDGIKLQATLGDVKTDINKQLTGLAKDLDQLHLMADLDIAASKKAIGRQLRSDFKDLPPIKLKAEVVLSAKDRKMLQGGSSPAKTPTPKPTPTPRAMGGHVSAGRPYRVGEEGEEIIIPRASGTVIPARNVRGRHRGGWLIEGHRHNADMSQYRDPRTGRWMDTVVRSDEELEAHRELGRTRRFSAGQPVGVPGVARVIPRSRDNHDPRVDPLPPRGGKIGKEGEAITIPSITRRTYQETKTKGDVTRLPDTVPDLTRSATNEKLRDYQVLRPDTEDTGMFASGSRSELLTKRRLDARKRRQTVKQYMAMRAEEDEVRRIGNEREHVRLGGRLPTSVGGASPPGPKFDPLAGITHFEERARALAQSPDISGDWESRSKPATPRPKRTVDARPVFHSSSFPAPPGEEGGPGLRYVGALLGGIRSRQARIAHQGEVHAARKAAQPPEGTSHPPQFQLDSDPGEEIGSTKGSIGRFGRVLSHRKIQYGRSSYDEGRYPGPYLRGEPAVEVLNAQIQGLPREEDAPYVLGHRAGSVPEGEDPVDTMAARSKTLPRVQDAQVRLEDVAGPHSLLPPKRPLSRFGPGPVPLEEDRGYQAAKFADRTRPQYGFTAGSFRHLDREVEPSATAEVALQNESEENRMFLEGIMRERDEVLKAARMRAPGTEGLQRMFGDLGILHKVVHGVSREALASDDPEWKAWYAQEHPTVESGITTGHVPKEVRRRIDEVMPGMGTVFGAQARAMGRLARYSPRSEYSPARNAELASGAEATLAMVNRADLRLRAHFERQYGVEGERTPRWDELSPEEQEAKTRFYDSLGAEYDANPDMDNSVLQLGTPEGNKRFYEAMRGVERGKVTKTPRKIKALRRQRGKKHEKRDPLGSIKLNSALQRRIDEGDPVAFRQARKLGLEDELRLAERDDQGEVAYSGPDFTIDVLNTMRRGARFDRLLAGGQVQLTQLEVQIKAYDEQAKEAKESGDTEGREEIIAKRRALKEQRSEVVKLLSAHVPTGARASGGLMNRASGGLMGRMMAAKGAKIQSLYDEGRYEEGQALNLEMEKMRAATGTGGRSSAFAEMLAEQEKTPAAPPTMSPFMEMVQQKRLAAKDMTGRAMGGPNYRGGARPSSLRDIEGVAQSAVSVTEVGEHGREAIAELPGGGQFVVPNHQLAPFKKMYGQGVNSEVFAQHPQGTPMSPWVRRAAMNQLGGKYLTGRHAGGAAGHAHPHEDVYVHPKTGRPYNVSGGFAPGRGEDYLPFGQFQAFDARGMRGRPTEAFQVPDVARQRPVDIYEGAPPIQQSFAGLGAAALPLQLEARASSRGINDAGGVGSGYGPHLALPGLNAQGGVAGGDYGPGLGEQIAQGFTQAVDTDRLGQSLGRAFTDSAQGLAVAPDEEYIAGTAKIRARSELRGGGPSAEQKKILEEIGVGQYSGDVPPGGYSQAIAEIRSRTSEALSLTPVRALSVSIGQIAQQLGGRAGIQRRAAVANAKAATAQRTATFLEREQENVRAGEIELGAQQAAGEDESTLAPLRQNIKRSKANVAYAQPLVARETAEAEQASRTVASRRQRLVAQSLGVGGIVAGTVLFTGAMQAAQGVLSGIAEAGGPMLDSMTGFTKTAFRVEQELALGAIGGPGAVATVAAAQAQRGLSLQTPETVRSVGLLAGSQNLEYLQDSVRAEQNLSSQSRFRGTLQGFNNGPFAGVPILGDLLGFIGQSQGLSERVVGTTGVRPAGNQTYADMIDQGADQIIQTGLGPIGIDRDVGKGTIGGSLLDLFSGVIEGLGEDVTPGTPEAVVADTKALERADAVWTQMNRNIDKINPKMGEFVTGLDQADPRVEATAKALEAFPEGKKLAENVREFGVAFETESGKLPQVVSDAFGPVSSTVTDALEAAVQGAALQDPRKLLESQQFQLKSQVRAQFASTAFQQQTVIPAQFARQQLTEPLSTSPKQGILPAGGVGLFGGSVGNAGSLDEYSSAIKDIRKEVQAFAYTGIDEMLSTLGVPDSAISSVREIGEEIRDLGDFQENLQLGAEQERYNEQLRISRRSLGDLVGLVGREAASYKVLADARKGGDNTFRDQIVQATKLGQLNRAQIDDQREMARLGRLQQLDQRELARISLARNQRELNLQLALSRLQAPGETPQERAVRRREAELVAKEKQQELDINKRTTRRGFGIEDIQYRSQRRGFKIEDISLRRQLGDALRAAGLSESERQIQLEVRGTGKLIEANKLFLQTETGFLDSTIELGTTMKQSAIQTQATIESQSGQFLDTFKDEVEAAFKKIRKEYKDLLDPKVGVPGESGVPGGGSSSGSGRRGSDQGRPRGRGAYAAGMIGTFNTPTEATFGEAGSEHVAILRNPRRGMFQGGGRGGGGSNVTQHVSVSIVNPQVRSDNDIDELVRKVQKAFHEEAELVGVA